MKTKITTLLILAFAIVHSQTFTNYTIDEIGLEFVLADAIVDDENNYWVTSWAAEDGSGISSFDGTAWQSYGTDDGASYNRYRGLFQSSNGLLYFGLYITNDTAGGFDVFDGNTWSNFDPFEGDTFNFETDVADFSEAANGDIWMMTNKGIAKYDGTNFETYADDGNVIFQGIAITVTSDALVWMTTNQGVSSLDGVNFNHYSQEDGLVEGEIFAIEEDVNGNIWFGSFGSNGSISFYDGTTFTTITEFTYPIRKIYVASDETVYFGSSSDGVAIYDGTDWSFLTDEDGLIDNRIRGIAEDADGNIVFSTWLGVSVYNPTLGIVSQFRPEFALFPNPAKHLISINANDFEMEKLAIYNGLGSLVKEQDISATTRQISMEDLSAGTYLFKFTDTAGNAVIKKVVKN